MPDPVPDPLAVATALCLWDEHTSSLEKATAVFPAGSDLRRRDESDRVLVDGFGRWFGTLDLAQQERIVQTAIRQYGGRASASIRDRRALGV